MLTHETDSLTLAKKIISRLSKHKRSLCCKSHAYNKCLQVHLLKIKKLIAEKKIISFVLPAFPAKSANRNKTFSISPDKGELLSLQFLNQLCESVKQFHLPGAEIIICSDGRVFNDLVQVRDEAVDIYGREIKNIIDEKGLTNIRLFSLDDYYKKISYTSMREHLVADFAESSASLKLKIKHDEIALKQFNGIHRFIYEDTMMQFPQVSKNKVRKIAKEITYQVVQRSNAWSMLVGKIFPHSIRLSIHPQLCGSHKIGIMLLKSNDLWATPWHRVVLYDGKEHSLVKKIDAENLGATPVFIHHKFSHYIISGG